ncbi:MAG: hypothetical protein A4E72_02001 [Syntrophus sp. PtaU1.Bin208]|nr:MAG: hypothetical protein A4E72_02001 [Syntrophus sp. PtaU1.Bin208]
MLLPCKYRDTSRIWGNIGTLPILNFFLLYGATSLFWQYLSAKFIFQFRKEVFAFQRVPVWIMSAIIRAILSMKNFYIDLHQLSNLIWEASPYFPWEVSPYFHEHNEECLSSGIRKQRCLRQNGRAGGGYSRYAGQSTFLCARQVSASRCFLRKTIRMGTSVKPNVSRRELIRKRS